MRIRSLLHIFLAGALLLVLLLGLANRHIMQRMDVLSARLAHAQASVLRISTLLILTHEYALYSEERAAQQWKENLAALGGQLNVDDSAANGPLAPRFDELRQQTAALSALFENLEAASQLPETPLQIRRKRLLLDQMLTNVSVLSDSVEHLQQATRVEYEKANRQHHRLSESIPWAVLVLLVLLSVLLRQRVLQPLARLQASVRAVAKGDLTVRSASTANDELGELSRTFDAMAVDLVAELRKEVAERQQLEIERQKFFLLAESSSEFIGMCDLDMTPLYVNPAGRRMVGLPDMAAACRVKVQDYYFPEDQRFIAEDFFPRVLREGHGDVEIRLRHFQTGEPIWVFYYLFSVHDASGTPIGWATTSRDITERKQAEAALQETQAMLARTEEIGKIGGWEFDINTLQQKWTEAIYAIHEVDFTGHPTVEQGINFYTPESRPIIEKAVQRAIEHGEPFDLELEIITAKGNLRAVHTIGRHDPVRGKIVGFFQDITERKHAARLLVEGESQRLAQMNAALEAQRQSSRAALSLMEDALTARRQAESLSAALNEQLVELRRWQQVTLDRENRILSVKKEINDLLAEHGQPPRYPSVLDEGAQE